MKIFKFGIAILSIVVLIVSCGKPTTPESLNPVGDGGYKIVTRFQTSAFAQDVTKKDNICYIAQGEGGLMIVNVDDVNNPVSISTTTEGIRGYSTKIAMKDTAVYMATGTFGVTALSVGNQEHPRVTAPTLSMKPAKNFYVIGDYLFTAISEQGVKIANISYAIQPDIRGVIVTSGYAHGIVTTADTNYLLVACGEMGLSIYNITDFQEGYDSYPLVGWSDIPGYAEAVSVMPDRKIAFMACGTAGLQVVDFSNSTNVHVVGSFDGTGYAKEVLYKNNKIFLTAEKGGLQVIDVADVTDPKLLGLVELDYALGIDIDDDYLYVADEVDGLVIVSIPK